MSPRPTAPIRREIPPTLRNIAFSMLIGVVAYLLAALSDEPRAWVVMVAVFSAVMCLIVLFIIDFGQRISAMETRQNDHYARMDELVKRGFSRIGEATELFAVVEESALRTDRAIQLVRDSNEIKSTTSAIVHDLAQAELDRLSRFLKELSGGATVVYTGEDRDWLLALTESVRSTLDATSVSTVDSFGRGIDGGFWLTDLGRRYLDLQSDIVRRGVRIRRVFIPDSPETAADPQFIRMCREQYDVGVDVRVLDPTGMRNTDLFDLVLFDEAISYEITPASGFFTSDRPILVNTRLDLDAKRVKERVRRFIALWDSAVVFEG